MKRCPCGSKVAYASCCGVYHSATQDPTTPEALMRSRYAAYALGNIDYIVATMRGKPLIGYNAQESKAWAVAVKWIGLKVIQSSMDSADLGFVEFRARYIEKGQHRAIHEISEFHRIEGKWFYVGGKVELSDKA